MRRVLGVMGNPIAHSLSPWIHRRFAQDCGHEISYEPILVSPMDFKGQVSQFFEQGACGLNITIPFKGQAFDFCPRRTPRATMAEAVNTLGMGSRFLWGDNTDGIGFMRDVRERWGFSPHKKKILLLGAGGAAKGVIGPLLQERPTLVTWVNRTPTKIFEFLKRWESLRLIDNELLNLVEGTLKVTTSAHTYDLVINATNSGLSGDSMSVESAWFHSESHVYDLMYGAEPTHFLQQATVLGAAHCRDGLGMLVEQAAEAYALWMGIFPNRDVVYQDLRSLLLRQKANEMV